MVIPPEQAKSGDSTMQESAKSADSTKQESAKSGDSTMQESAKSSKTGVGAIGGELKHGSPHHI